MLSKPSAFKGVATLLSPSLPRAGVRSVLRLDIDGALADVFAAICKAITSASNRRFVW